MCQNKVSAAVTADADAGENAEMSACAVEGPVCLFWRLQAGDNSIFGGRGACCIAVSRAAGYRPWQREAEKVLPGDGDLMRSAEGGDDGD